MLARWAIGGLVAAMLLVGLTTGELYRNEGLRARVAAEALASGQWLVPTLDGEPRLTKPPGMSVLIAVCSLPAGEVSATTARLPSVVAGLLAVVAVGWAVGRCCGRDAGWLAAAVLPCCLLWLDRVPSAEIDLVQLAWVTAALLFFLRAAEADGWGWWLLAFLGVAGGFFTKWTAPAFFYLTVVPFLVWRGRVRLLLSPGHLIGLGVFVALVVGWLGLIVSAAGWAEVEATLSREALLRLSPRHHPRPYPWDELVTFPLGFLAGCLPWVVLLPLALRPSFVRRLDDRQRDLWLLAVCWLASSLVFWTLVPGHRPRHILPAQPAVAVLATLALVYHPWPRPVLAGTLTLCLAAKLAFVGVVVPARLAGRESRHNGTELARLVPADEVLHLLALKDDGLLFYYARPTRRLDALPETPAWCLLTEREYAAGAAWCAPAARLHDSQGRPLYLLNLR